MSQLWGLLAMTIAIFENFTFHSQLKTKGLAIRSLFAGTPGYLDFVYFKWCKENSKNPFPRLILRLVLLSNVILAATISGIIRNGPS